MNGRIAALQIWIASGPIAMEAVEYSPGLICHPQGIARAITIITKKKEQD